MNTASNKSLIAHYECCWANQATVKKFDKGPWRELPASFCVLEFAPTAARSMWTYATCDMSQPADQHRLEVHLFSPIHSELHVELLTAIAHYHRTGQPLGYGHTVNFGRPWLNGSLCEYGLISLPYIDGPSLESFSLDGDLVVRCLWLVPITKAERDYKVAFGQDALEHRFEEAEFSYLDPTRKSVV